MPVLPRPSRSTIAIRATAVIFSLLAAGTATVLLLEVALQDGSDLWDYVRAVLILVTTAWLAWGAGLALSGLAPQRRTSVPEMQEPQPPTVVLVPICNEDPVTTFARIAAMDRSIRQAGVAAHVAILSDTRDPQAADLERRTFVRLLQETEGEGRIFYRRRTDNRGRKAGNVEDFFRKSGSAYELAVILDADSLMEGSAIRAMIARMQADSGLGLLQTLPRVIGGRSFFARAMQFAAAFHGPVFTRGLARMQGAAGPFWGHNAIVRVRAFAASCALPELQGKPPFGGHILSHDYVEAALLARAGWKVEVDSTINGSFEEGPENLLSFAKRDRRWCQGNLQHMRLLTAPGLAPWSRFVFVQGIFAYLVSLLWAGFLVASLIAAITAPVPDYFPDPHQLFPVFPSDRTKEMIALMLGIFGLLIMPKFAILLESVLARRDAGFGGWGRAALSVLAEILLTSLIAPLMLMYQTRAVLQVLSGRDGGWPASQRAEGWLSLRQGVRAGLWIMVTGALALGATAQLSPGLAPWLLPVSLPMILAPALIAWTSRPLTHKLFITPDELDPSPVVRDYRATVARWTDGPAAAAVPQGAPLPGGGTSHAAA
ncbi:glucans biosynthesis glucosyltransferase MdoH [Salipiger marinus]|uniref:Glucans biosynthesis glucosyltransferase H n=1 Tax=Salipiger marinus TaxID=555512 RepID=A0A1G8JN77_9RHOB|nr:MULTISPECIES: glucans biosynthesis glucosyltransferase MdoH [Salipiger]MCD1619957.1 glucans biosynthesis glucosyltransferase MdoH [Salipiger manganoxidans]MEB3420904.1 glucans biosynthesis glucosyltransferase MdoH [Salipiger manganoxidans]SDI32090.1 membrane glycosyltransferase [Salipiger marinus]